MDDDNRRMKRRVGLVLLIVLLFLFSFPAYSAVQEYVSLRHYVETMFSAHEKQQAAYERALTVSLDLARVDMERRLAALNELRAEVIKDRSQFVRMETFDERKKFTDQTLSDIKERLTAIEVRSVTWMTAIGVFFVVLQIFLSYWKSRADNRRYPIQNNVGGK